MQGIVRAHKGALQVSSVSGKGTTFLVLLPASAGPAQLKPAPRPEAARGAGTVLVVDDQELVRALAKAVLERGGYSVLLAQNGDRAVEIIERERERISIVLLDLIMPGLSAEETLGRLRALRPNLKVLLTSRFSEVEARRRFPGPEMGGFLQKPFTAASLMQKLSSTLAGAAVSAE